MSSSETILVVDDDADILAVTCAAIKRDGYEVEGAGGGEEAIAKLALRPYDIVLSDLFMPGMMGTEVLKKIKDIRPATDVIIMTGSPSLETAIQALKDGAYDYILKPFKKDYLHAVLKRCADHRSTRKELAAEKQLREELQAAYQELKKLEHLQEGFIGRVSHELRTPLAQVLGSLEILEKMPPSDPAKFAERVAVARRGTERLKELVEDIVRFSAVSRPDIKLEASAVQVLPIFEAILAQTKTEWEGRKLTVRLSFEPGTPAVLGDPQLLERAFLHLFRNAIRFNKEGGRIEVGARKLDKTLLIAIKDTGEGVPEEAQKTIFDAFYQIAEYMSRQVGGLGLGLALVKRIVECHGGSVLVDSAQGQGSTFKVLLPLAGDSLPPKRL